MQWIDGEIKADKGLARRVSKLASAMKAESCGVSESALDRARHGERIVLRQGGRAVAAMVPIADLKRLQKLETRKTSGIFAPLASTRAPSLIRIGLHEVCRDRQA